MFEFSYNEASVHGFIIKTGYKKLFVWHQVTRMNVSRQRWRMSDNEIDYQLSVAHFKQRHCASNFIPVQ